MSSIDFDGFDQFIRQKAPETSNGVALAASIARAKERLQRS